MAFRVAAALALVMAMGAAIGSSTSSSSFSVLYAPEYLTFDSSATTLSPADVPRVAASILGLYSESTWSGIASPSPFKRPKAVVLIAVDSCVADSLSVDAQAVFPMQEVTSASSALRDVMNSQPLGVSIVSAYGSDATLHAVSVDDRLARDAMPRMASKIRALTWDHTNQLMRSADMKTVVGTKEVLAFCSSGALGTGVRVAETTVVVDLADNSSFSFDLTKEAHLMLLTELVAMHTIVSRVEASSSTAPTAVLLAVSSLRALVREDGDDVAACQAAVTLLRAFLRDLISTAKASMGDDLAVLMATVTADEAASSASMTRSRRDLVSPNDFKPTDPAFVEHCQEYDYFCSADHDGKEYNPTTRCSTSCSSSAPCTDCAYLPCSKTSPYMQPFSARCKTCEHGFTRYGNHCYKDTNFPVIYNIILWLGIAALFSTIGICYALGWMDPGRNSVIYRMTSQRVKTQ